MKIFIFLTVLLLLISLTNFTTAQKLTSQTEWKFVFDGLDFPEGPIFDSKGNLYLSNCYGSWIAKYDGIFVDTFLVKNENSVIIDKTNGLTIVDDTIYACDYGIGAILMISLDAKVEIMLSGFEGKRFNRPNDIIYDGKENIIFTDPKSYGKDILDGRIFTFNLNTNELKLIADNLAFPNGINISPFDKKLYVCESAKEQIIRYDVIENGQLVNKEIFIKLPGGDPDGIEFDDQGNIYVAHFGGQAVYVISPSGIIINKIITPGKKPTNLAFRNGDYKTLYLTEVETNSVYKINLGSPDK